ncbi:hypothetical protein C4D60_Mb02t14680 [Musa balbisiana]|uniref:Uncharacterized protein n=1 Tax=Musa balbisiana TaxID=52838 RepID=A0A4S8IAR3_MUSBA|nr:hypothetical protein C4D60_Mb02t14680 [Musa balbisiana]
MGTGRTSKEVSLRDRGHSGHFIVHEPRRQLLAIEVGFDHVYPSVDTRRLFNASSPPDSSEQRGVLPSSPLLSSPS